jgi:hypothetical protein
MVVHSLLDLPLVGLVEHGGDDLLDAYGHLPTDSLLLVCGPVAPDRGRVVAVPAGRVPEGVTHAIDALLAQHLW